MNVDESKIIELLTEIRDLLKPKRKAKQDKLLLDDDTIKIWEIWNGWVEGLPKVHSVSPNSTRYTRMQARWKEHPNEGFWITLIKRINESAFCHGKNTRKWNASFDFLIRPDTPAKIMEGLYDNEEKAEKKNKQKMFVEGTDNEVWV